MRLPGSQRQRSSVVRLRSYLARYDSKGVSKVVTHGVLCMTKAGCNTCAFDLTDAEGDPKTAKGFDALVLQKNPPQPGAEGSAICASCHTPGPVLPKASMWQEGHKHLQPINQECVSVGGPTWLCMGNATSWPPPNTANIVKPGDVSAAMVQTCGGGGCHAAGFLRDHDTTTYCSILRTAFLPGGAMRENGHRFPSKSDCMKWLELMKCDQINTEAFCEKPEISQP
jgi:hypothetical protein